MSRFEDCLKVVLAYEGGDSDVPSDRGGKTRWGITQNTLDRWCYITGHEKVFVYNMTPEQRDNIYQTQYWQPPCCYDLPKPLDLVVFDAAVNHGVGKSIRMLQALLGCTPDGLVGAVTIKKAKECNARRIACAMIARRGELYNSIVKHDPTQAKFLRGWLNRIDKLQTEVSK